MPGTIQPIQTTYQGRRYRSRLEARWAVFFDSMGIEYQYEKEGYSLPSGPYLPDFWLPRLEMWVEIKPTDPSKREADLVGELEDLTSKKAVIFSGECAAGKYRIHAPRESMREGATGWLMHCRKCDGYCIEWENSGWSEIGKHNCGDNGKWPTPIGDQEFHAAMSARFEHGETPNVRP